MQVDEGPKKRPALLALSVPTVMRESVSVAQGSQSVARFYGSTRSPMHFLSPQNWHPCRFIFVSQLLSGRLFRRLTVSLICRHSAASGLHRSKHSIMAKQFTFCTYCVLEIWLNVGHFPHSLLYSMTNQDLKLVMLRSTQMCHGCRGPEDHTSTFNSVFQKGSIWTHKHGSKTDSRMCSFLTWPKHFLAPGSYCLPVAMN